MDSSAMASSAVDDCVVPSVDEATARHNLINYAMASMTTRDDHNQVMALIDFHYHNNDTAAQWNTRLRNNVSVCYNKIGLTEQDRELFTEWQRALDILPNNAARLDIFAAAPLHCLEIVGL